MNENNPVRTVIVNFLRAAASGNLPHNPMNPAGPKLQAANNPDILQLYNPSMEVQVNVSPTGAESVEGRRNTWTKDGQTFWHIRVPKDAMSDPHWNDYTLDWSLTQYAEAVGMTGWDWANKKSRWVAFDFDAITGHAPGVGVTDEKLQQVRDAAINIPWVQTRRSTRGGGLHMYVFFDDEGIPTENHTIHQGLARCILSIMSQEAGFNFASAIDACGGNMWIWHRDATPANEGLSLVNESTQIFSISDLPSNWKDHIEVVTRKRTKIRIKGIPEAEDNDFDTMASSRNIIPLDETHKDIINMLSNDEGCTTVWVPEYNLLQTHTTGFAKLKEEHPERFVGFFETNSAGQNLSEPNCLAGDTKVVTREGLKPIRELAGKTVNIMTSWGKWVDAPFKSYGTQAVFSISLRKMNVTKTIKATADHRWFVCKDIANHSKLKFNNRREVITSELKQGLKVVQVFPQLKCVPSLIGIQHGLVWGDGSIGGGRISAQLPLIGEKDANLIHLFKGHQIRDRKDGVEIWNLPKIFKSLVPLHYDKPYLYGWLAGYFAADGCVDTNGTCVLKSANKESIQHVRDICHILGIDSSHITHQERISNLTNKPHTMYATHLKRSILTEEFFLLDSHRKRFLNSPPERTNYWTIENVEPTGSEEVFCCTVPETHCFVLEDSILSGNCFAFPMPDGGWKVYRFGKGHKEHESWVQDGRSYTTAYFNCRPDLETASLSMGAAEIDNGFQFESLHHAARAAKALGADLFEVEGWMEEGRETELQRVKATGRLKIKIEKRKGDTKPGLGWYEKRGHWEKIFKVECNPREIKNAEYPEFDNIFRAMVTPGGEHAGWSVWDPAQSDWDMQPANNVKMMLQADGYIKNEAEQIMGSVLKKRWRLVNMPFQPEFPGNRQWNYKSPQLRYPPAILADDEVPKHPHWNKILDHIGNELDEVLADYMWAIRYGIKTGRQYLQLWIASMVREPFEPLPYLFLYGPENSGKSILHEAIGKLITGGICRADKPLTTTGEHNGELANAVLAIVEETNLNGRGGERALGRMKDWVTADHITIRRMRTDTYLQLNTLHFIQASNDRDHCLIMHGDTRITMLYVASLDFDEEIPKGVLKKALENEAPHFMRTLMDLEIPPAQGRLRIPVIATREKEQLEQLNMNSLLRFIGENTFQINGAKILFQEFYKKFQSALPEEEKGYWTNKKVSGKLPRIHPSGRAGGEGGTFIGNMAWDSEVKTNGTELVLVDRRLRSRT